MQSYSYLWIFQCQKPFCARRSGMGRWKLPKHFVLWLFEELVLLFWGWNAVWVHGFQEMGELIEEILRKPERFFFLLGVLKFRMFSAYLLIPQPCNKKVQVVPHLSLVYTTIASLALEHQSWCLSLCLTQEEESISGKWIPRQRNVVQAVNPTLQ